MSEEEVEYEFFMNVLGVVSIPMREFHMHVLFFLLQIRVPDFRDKSSVIGITLKERHSLGEDFPRIENIKDIIVQGIKRRDIEELISVDHEGISYYLPNASVVAESCNFGRESIRKFIRDTHIWMRETSYLGVCQALRNEFYPREKRKQEEL